MSKRFVFTSSLLVVLISILFSSCIDCLEGNGKIATRSAKFSEITAISLGLSADVFLVSDSSDIVKIEGESNLIEAIILEQRGTKLKITSEPCISSSMPIKITIPVKTLTDLQINGSGSITSENKLSASNLDLGINGSGDINLNIDAANLMSQINGSGNIIMKGSAQHHKITVNGSGNVEAADMPTGKVSIVVNGSGDCKVMATTALAIKIRGSGSVYYSGSPDISSDIKGSGSIEKIK